APTTSEARKVFVPPPGFHRVTDGQHVVFCEPADDAWVNEAMKGAKPATQPTTMPTDVIARINSDRAALKSHIIADLKIADPKAVDQLLDEKLLPQLKNLANINPPIVFFLTSTDRMKALLRGGWTDSHFYYNRVADEVDFMPDLNLSEKGQMNDMLVPAIYP